MPHPDHGGRGGQVGPHPGPLFDLHADATQPATGHLALPVLSLPFPVSPMSRCEDLKIQKTLRF